MTIQTHHFNDLIHNLWLIKVEYEALSISVPIHEEFMHGEEIDIQDELHRMGPVIQLLQSELDTLITATFFIWLCTIFPSSGNLPEGNKLRFSNEERNVKPTVQTIISIPHIQAKFVLK
jgi:hypothetical protein